MTVLELFSAETKGKNKELISYPGEAFKAECELVGLFASSRMWGMTVYKKDGIWYECFRSFTGVSWYKYSAD